MTYKNYVKTSVHDFRFILVNKQFSRIYKRSTCFITRVHHVGFDSMMRRFITLLHADSVLHHVQIAADVEFAWHSK